MSEQSRGDPRERGQVGWRRTDDGVKISDPDNPEAWVSMAFKAGIPPEHRLFAVCPECGFAAPQRAPPGTRMVCGECDAELDGC